MKALFGRKILNLKELKGISKKVNKDEFEAAAYEVTREIVLNDKEYKKFTENFSIEQPWITEEDGGVNEEGEIVCIRVKKEGNKKGILVNSEGYTYPKYIAIES